MVRWILLPNSVLFQHCISCQFLNMLSVRKIPGVIWEMMIWAGKLERMEDKRREYYDEIAGLSDLVRSYGSQIEDLEARVKEVSEKSSAKLDIASKQEQVGIFPMTWFYVVFFSFLFWLTSNVILHNTLQYIHELTLLFHLLFSTYSCMGISTCFINLALAYMILSIT